MPCKNECAIIDTIYTRSVPTNCPINDSLAPPWVENIVIFVIRAAVSEIQLILTLNGKLALIGY